MTSTDQIFNLVAQLSPETSNTKATADIAHFEISGNDNFVKLLKSGLNRLDLEGINKARQAIAKLEEDDCLSKTLEILDAAEELLKDLNASKIDINETNSSLSQEAQIFFDNTFKGKKVKCQHNSGNPIPQVKRTLNIA